LHTDFPNAKIFSLNEKDIHTIKTTDGKKLEKKYEGFGPSGGLFGDEDDSYLELKREPAVIKEEKVEDDKNIFDPVKLQGTFLKKEISETLPLDHAAIAFDHNYKRFYVLPLETKTVSVALEHTNFPHLWKASLPSSVAIPSPFVFHCDSLTLNEFIIKTLQLLIVFLYFLNHVF
jgi:hypothetical protein